MKLVGKQWRLFKQPPSAHPAAPLPRYLNDAAQLVKRFRKGRYAESLEASLNRAA